MFPDGSVWIDATTLDGDVARVCKRFGYEGERPRTLLEAARFLATVLHEQRGLVVIDNVWPDKIDMSVLPVVGGMARTVITSRTVTLHESLGVPARPLELGRWILEACRSYIREVVRSLAGSSDKDMDGAPLVDKARAKACTKTITCNRLALADLRTDALGALDALRRTTTP